MEQFIIQTAEILEDEVEFRIVKLEYMKAKLESKPSGIEGVNETTATFETKKVRKFVWVILGIILICSYIYQRAIRPLIIEQQTGKAIEVSEGHLEEEYPMDSWGITDTDDFKIEPVINLHVIFDSEPKVVYEYTVEDTVVRQISM